MNRLYNEEKILNSLRSVFHLQSALTDYLQSVLSLLESEFDREDTDIIADTIYTLMKDVNELQKNMNTKLDIFCYKYTEAEILSVYLEYKPSNEDCFPQYVWQLYKVTRKCPWSNWKRKQIAEEFKQFFLLYKKRRKMLNAFRTYKNDINKVWLLEDVCCKKPFENGYDPLHHH